MSGLRRAHGRTLAAALAVVVSIAGPPVVPGLGAATVLGAPADVVFEPPTADAVLGEPVTFRTAFRASSAPRRVELVTRLPGSEERSVRIVPEVVDRGDGTFEASVLEEGHVSPDTTWIYRFRAVTADGVVEGPEAEVTVTDERFDWRTMEGDVVRFHWYEGDESFAMRALTIADRAIARASALMGATIEEPVDFFVYAAEAPFREALGPGTRENVGGRANPATGTLTGLIRPEQIDADWVDVLVSHELTHLVFAEAVDNPFHLPPRWLNEGVAVYLSEGYGDGHRAEVAAAVRDGSLIPLSGLGGFFPTSRERFSLAYAESVSAVDHFIATHGEPRLVELIRSYQDGVTDDEAFRAATGGDLATFDAGWARAQGTEVARPVGPQPAPPGPLPPGWEAPVDPPGAAAGPVATSPGGSNAPSPQGPHAGRTLASVLLAWTFVVVVVIAGSLLVLRRRRPS